MTGLGDDLGPASACSLACLATSAARDALPAISLTVAPSRGWRWRPGRCDPLGGAVVLGELGLGGHLVGGGGELAGVARHLFDGAVDLGDKVVEAGRHLGQFVTAIDPEALGEVAITAASLR